MSTPAETPARTRQAWFFAGLLVVALILAGAISYFAYPHPDGLDTVTLEGCVVTEVDGAEGLSGECIAQNARDHPLANSPFADYTINGDGGFVGLAGVLGVLATLVVAGGLFWLLRRRSSSGSGGST